MSETLYSYAVKSRRSEVTIVLRKNAGKKNFEVMMIEHARAKGVDD
ncbi:MAG TPA: hypothetical protein VFV58_11890 [Blastocatellia bacterium]|jgi:hypothetical protein|nr:hypothetical protein [Blastocatellia bacterium]